MLRDVALGDVELHGVGADREGDVFVLLLRFLAGGVEVCDLRVQGEVLVVPLVVAAGILETDCGEPGLELRPCGHRRGRSGIRARAARDGDRGRGRRVLAGVLVEVRALPRVDVAVVRLDARRPRIVSGRLHVHRSAREQPHGDEEHEDGPEEPFIAGAIAHPSRTAGWKAVSLARLGGGPRGSTDNGCPICHNSRDMPGGV